MTYTAVSYFILVGVHTMLILASEGNTTSYYEGFTPALRINSTSISDTSNMPNDTVTSMSPMINSTVNQTVTSNADFLTTKGPYSTARESTKGTPPTPMKIKTTPKSRMLLTTAEPSSVGGDTVGIVIVVVIIAIALLAALICYIARSKGRRYSVDFSSKPEEAQIPLSTVEPEAPVETIALNGLEFEGTEDSAQEPQATQETHEPEVKLEDEVEQKAEPEKAAVDAAPPADTSEEQPKQDVSEQSPAAPVEPSGGEKTDDEGAASSTTSVESLKESNEANENNSNSTVLPQRGARDGEPFWDMSCDNMV